MRTAYGAHVAQVSESCVPVICHDSCDLEDGVPLDKDPRFEDGADVISVLMEGQRGNLELERAQNCGSFCADANSEITFSAREFQRVREEA